MDKEKTVRSLTVFLMYFCKACCGLFFADSSCRTNSCTCSAANAGTCIDYELAVSLRNSSYWTLWLACTTAYARIRNYECHLYSLLKIES